MPLIAWGVHRAILSNSNDVRDWLPAEYAETQEYQRFTQHFGVQDFIVASWPGCTLTDQRLDEFARVLAERNRSRRDVSAVFADSHRAFACSIGWPTPPDGAGSASGRGRLAGLDRRAGRPADVCGADVGGRDGRAPGADAGR